jgi:uncharacterized protein (TIGR00730 family)
VPHKPRRPATADEELLGAERPAILPVRTDAERVGDIVEDIEAGFAALHDLGPAVSFFGSARIPQDDPRCVLARHAARRLGEEGFAIITGGGPGIMEAANRGAQEVGATSVGLNIELPHEQAPNPHQDLELHFRFFFTRKLMFVRYATAFVVFPGGYGTFDELFEALVLEQVNKIQDFPVVLVEREFWSGLLDWVQARLLPDELIAADDPELLVVTDDLEEIVEAVLAGHERQEAA